MSDNKIVVRVQDVNLLESPDSAMRDSVLISAARDLSAGIVWVAPNSTIHEDVHDCDEVYYVIRGQADVVIEGMPHQMVAGNAVFVPAGRRHKVDNLSASVCEFFWCIAAGWETLQDVQKELGSWPIVDVENGWHMA